jgi:hypothetical protein
MATTVVLQLLTEKKTRYPKLGAYSKNGNFTLLFFGGSRTLNWYLGVQFGIIYLDVYLKILCLVVTAFCALKYSAN